MDRARYFDNAATTPLDPRVREAMRPYLDEDFGNASSIHTWGLRAHEAVERARVQVATLIGAEDPTQIIFTSGATEANNWVLGAADELWISPFEHSALREPALARGACAITNRPGTTELMPFPVRDGALVSVMAVNNEVGAQWDVRDVARDTRVLRHSDITQAVGKLPVTVTGLDFASFSGHKFYGPKGVGALYCLDQGPPPLIRGGEQERGARGGTLNVAGIVGMGRAAEIALDERPADHVQAEELKHIFIDGLNGLSDTCFNGGERTSPFLVSVSFRGLQGESIVLDLDRSGYAISAGAACSSRSTEPSHVLKALSLEAEWLRGTVRVSFGRFNSKEAASGLAKGIREAVENFRKL